MATHNATIERKDDSATLRLTVGTTVLDIMLTEDKPNDVKSVFNKLLEELKSGEFDFNLTDAKEDLYHHICKEYLIQLNTELKSTYKELQDNGLLKVGE
ncbi:MAG: hypothetical protein KF803_06645 [Cyclobacteriaceae bacterium]|nr:hypothetical protein [Cyclobacteriaceae bacterium]